MTEKFGTGHRHSYDFDQFSDEERQNELERLYFQATICKDKEAEYLKKTGLKPDMKALEIGCGPGFVTGILAELVPNGEAHGLDFSHELLETAKQVVQPQHSNTKFFHGDCYDTKLPDNTYDVIYNRMVYQHLKDPIQALKEAKRIAKPGGKIIIADVDAGSQFIYPHCPEFDQLNELACQAQEKIEGDRFIARKIPYYMQNVGIHDIHFELITVSSFDIDPAIFLDITTKFKAMQIGTDEAYQLCDQVYKHCQNLKYPPLIYVGAGMITGTIEK